MQTFVRKGWKLALRHKYVLVVLFLYRLLWGFFLYRFVDSLVSPVLARFPDNHPNPNAVRLFWIEAQFRLLKTDLANEALLLLAGMFLLRMAVTPLVNAGLYYSFYHSGENQGTHVLAGMRRRWKPIAALYVLEKALAIAPLLWLVPLAKDRYIADPSLSDWVRAMLPYALAWVAWSFAVHLASQFMQFGAASGRGILPGLIRACRRALPLCGVSLAVFGLGAAASLAVTAAAFLWTGFAAVVLHQGFQLVRALLSLWTSASQYEVWKPESF